MEQHCFHASCISISLIVVNIGTTKMTIMFKIEGQPYGQFLSLGAKIKMIEPQPSTDSKWLCSLSC